MTKRRYRPVFLSSVLLLLLSALLLICSRASAGFAEWYAARIFPAYSAALGRANSLLPFSCSELLLLIVMIFVCVALVRIVLRLVRGKSPLPLLGALIFLASALLFFFMIGAGVNYSRATFAQTYALEVRPSTKEELASLVRILVGELSEMLPAAADGSGPDRLPDNYPQLCRQAMTRLGQYYPTLDRFYARPKAALLSPLLSQARITGVYSPFLCEAQYNSMPPAFSLPFTICHELAHTAGYAREEEANFIAYLACSQADQAALRYSGALSALVYTLNAYYQVAGSEDYLAMYELLPDQAKADLAANSRFWAQYQGKTAKLAEKANDAYLKANDQSAGTQSYGAMVDLLLAYYREK